MDKAILIFLVIVGFVAYLQKYEIMDDPYFDDNKLVINEEDKTKFINTIEHEKPYGFRSLLTGKIYTLLDNLPEHEHEQFEPITKKEFDSKGIRSLTNHIDSIINESTKK